MTTFSFSLSVDHPRLHDRNEVSARRCDCPAPPRPQAKKETHMEIKSLQEQRNALFTKMRRSSSATSSGPEERSAFDAMNARLATIESEDRRFESFEKLETEQR